MEEIIHIFTKGVDLDTEKAFRSNEVAYGLTNFRLVTDKNGTTGAIENIPGNTLVGYTANPYVTISTIVGTCVVRDRLVLFGRDTQDSCYIATLKLDENDDVIYTSFKLVYSDRLNEDGSTLDFPEENLKAVGRYESESIVKVYWVDNVNPIRYINIAIHNTTDGNEYNTSYPFIKVDKLELVSDVTFKEFKSIETTAGGNLKAGIVQYAYQYYNLYGTESLISPLSQPIHITEYSDTKTNTLEYKGSDIDTKCNKSVKIAFEHIVENNIFNRLKVIRLFYDSFGSLPVIDLVADIKLAMPTEYVILDTGRSLYNYTAEELSVIGNALFKAKDLAVKDNLLFVANIEEDYFDIDFEARAFRFPANAGFTVANSKSIYIRNNNVDSWYDLDNDTEEDWDTTLSYIDYYGKNDCINLHNDLTYNRKLIYSDPKYNCMFQYNSTIYGGTGKNIKYEFIEDEFILDDQASVSKTGDVKARTIRAGSGTGDNYSYTNYASPYMVQKYTGYSRGEIYRFAIVFIGDKGRVSKPKWIGDIRFPNFSYSSRGLAKYDNNKVYSKTLGINFYVKNVPEEAKGWFIVRVPRTDLDKTVISQGYITTAVEYSSSLNPNPVINLPQFPTAKTNNTIIYGGIEGSVTSVASTYDKILLYNSPDIDYDNFNYKEGDFFDYVGYMNDYCTFKNSTSAGLYLGDESTIKYVDFKIDPNAEIISSSVYDVYPNDYVFVSPSAETESFVLGGVEIEAKHKLSPNRQGIPGKGMLFSYSGLLRKSDSSEIYSPVIVNLRRINNSQYGGNTYEARFNNEYIKCGDIVTEDSPGFTRSNTYVDEVPVFGGDVYINMYEKLYSIYYPDSYKMCRIVYIPLESVYNLDLNNGFTYSRNVSSESNIKLIRENSGLHSDGSSTLLDQKDVFYKYNTVYSYNNPPTKYLPETDFDSAVLKYDTRVLVSLPKMNNELVDSWSKFQVNNFLDVDSNYGEIFNLINYKDNIYFFQRNGLGILSINERAVLTAEGSASPLVLGTGGVLDRYVYYTTYYGNKDFKSPIVTESGIYWIDSSKNEFLLFNGEQIMSISKTKMIDSFFKNNYNKFTRIVSTYVSKYNEVWVKLETDTDLGVLVFNELIAAPAGFYTIPAYGFIPLRTELLSIYKGPEDSVYNIWKENSNNKRANFYNKTYDSEVKVLCTEGYPYVKVWDNIEYSSITKDAEGVNIFNDTFSILQIYNDYQNTGEVELIKDSNIKRRERNWTLAVPRNIVNKNVSTDSNILDISNLDSTQLFKDRIRDNYIMLKFIYKNDIEGISKEHTFSVPYINVKYRISNR